MCLQALLKISGQTRAHDSALSTFCTAGTLRYSFLPTAHVGVYEDQEEPLQLLDFLHSAELIRVTYTKVRQPVDTQLLAGLLQNSDFGDMAVLFVQATSDLGHLVIHLLFGL